MKNQFCTKEIIIFIVFLFVCNILISAEKADKPKTLVTSNNKFGLNLYKKFNDEQGNLFFSPHSITSALLMTYEGANGKTAEEMRSVMHLPQSKNSIRTDFKDILDEINNKAASYKLETANALWIQKKYPFVEDYFNTIRKYYGGRVTNLDFSKKAEESRITINEWIEGKTEDKIKNLIPKGMLNAMTVSVLTNAIYFKANWLVEFRTELTRDEKFTWSSGKGGITPMMHNTGYYGYTETKDIQILEMDYKGNEISMMVILPKTNDIQKLEARLNLKNLNCWRDSLRTKRVKVSLPKFKFETKYFMSEDLQEMGMKTAFEYPQADFTGISPTGELFISEVVHQTFVEVAEYGTEAAAATAVVMEAGAAMPTEEPKIFKADHPFIFIIQQKNTGNILFMGKLYDPTKEIFEQ